jgi:hypothetical protein
MNHLGVRVGVISVRNQLKIDDSEPSRMTLQLQKYWDREKTIKDPGYCALRSAITITSQNPDVPHISTHVATN